MRTSPNNSPRATSWFRGASYFRSVCWLAALLPLLCSCRALSPALPDGQLGAAPGAAPGAAEAPATSANLRRADEAITAEEGRDNDADEVWQLSDAPQRNETAAIEETPAETPLADREKMADRQKIADQQEVGATWPNPIQTVAWKAPALPLPNVPSATRQQPGGPPAVTPHTAARTGPWPMRPPHARHLPPPHGGPTASLPASATTTGGACACCSHSGGYGQWTPPGLKQPWPEDEYLCDGGDRLTAVRVAPDWTVYGLDQEDTVAHFDTKDGRTIVEPSNSVCIYSPRFSAVRRVDGLVQYKQRQHMAGVQAPLTPGLSEERVGPTTVNQPLQPQRHLASTPLDIFQERTRGLTVDRAEVPSSAENAFLPYEDFLLIRRGQFDLSEKPRLAERIDAALAWTDNKAVQVVIDETLATEAVGTNKLESVYTYELEGKPRLRICKVASTHAARPGQIVEFTLRFDNVGDQTIGNVTIIDHLTTRLEYVEDSESCTLDADFFAVDDDDLSLVLRWEIKEPMKVGEGGLIRFKCRVR